MKIKAEIRMIYLQVRESLRLLENHEKKKRGIDDALILLLSEGINSVNTLILNFWPKNLSDKKFPLFRLPSLWYCITATLGNLYMSSWATVYAITAGESRLNCYFHFGLF